MNHGLVILRDEQVRDIRSQYLDGDCSMAELSREYGVRRSTIQAVLEGRAWAELLAEGEADALRKMRMERQNPPTNKHRR
jgi:predicted DNA-binding protein YlxM (UPF0122 family)